MRPLPKLLTPAKLAEFKATAKRTPANETFLLGNEKGGELVRVITPVLGGNVESFDPGTIDVVRVPTIRGALRWWWRALHPDLSTAELRALERSVWGGVGKDANESACASPVRIRVKVTNAGAIKPAGTHERKNDRLKALPTWHAADALGITQAAYALFPLQQPDAERTKFKGAGAMPTKTWRVGLVFELWISVLERSGHALTPEEQGRVREALWLWLTFGGYGARTRRGFGALHAEAVRYDDACAILARARQGRPRADRPTLAGCDVLEGRPSRAPLQQARSDPRAGGWQAAGRRPVHRGPSTNGAGQALGVMLEALHEFRQGTRFGRNPGREKAYGRSRWPEADGLRALSGERFVAHPVDASFRRASAPRAEFGLPINITFVTEEDKPANGSVASSAAGGRWASPLLLRPVCTANGSYVPVVLVLAGYRPARAWLTLKRGATARPSARRRGDPGGESMAKEVDVSYEHAVHGGATEAVRVALQPSGSALDAFVSHLVGTRSFQRPGEAR